MDRKGPLVVLEYPGGKGGGMTSIRYQQQVLAGPLLDFYNDMKVLRGYMPFQQDGAPSHTSRSTAWWLSSHNIPQFFHPPSSPDLNPIEPLWLELKRALYHHNHTPTTIQQLKDFARMAWDQISVETVNGHIGRMHDRVAAVIVAKGGHTQF